MAVEDEVMNNIMKNDTSEQALGHFRMIYKNTSNEISDLMNVENWDKKESKLYMKYVAELYKSKVNRYANRQKISRAELPNARPLQESDGADDRAGTGERL